MLMGGCQCDQRLFLESNILVGDLDGTTKSCNPAGDSPLDKGAASWCPHHHVNAVGCSGSWILRETKEYRQELGPTRELVGGLHETTTDGQINHCRLCGFAEVVLEVRGKKTEKMVQRFNVSCSGTCNVLERKRFTMNLVAEVVKTSVLGDFMVSRDTRMDSCFTRKVYLIKPKSVSRDGVWSVLYITDGVTIQTAGDGNNLPNNRNVFVIRREGEGSGKMWGINVHGGNDDRQ